MREVASDTLEALFPGNSEMSRRMRETDWSKTPLGDPHGWPDALIIPVRMMLASRFGMWLGWGPNLQFFYNDAYIPTLGRKHPLALGRPFREVWSEVYDDVEDQVEAVWRGEATWNESLLLLLDRRGYPEETYHSFSYSPLHDSRGTVVGLMCVVTEETERVINERRMAVLRSLGAELLGARDETGIVAAASKVLGGNRDFPFAQLHLAESARQARNAYTDKTAVSEDTGWPTLESGPTIFPLPEGHEYPAGPWNVSAAQALLVPIPGVTGQAALGTLVLGLNPFRRDDDLSGFAQIIAGLIGGALGNVATLNIERRRSERIWSQSRDLMVVIDANGLYRSVSPAWTAILGHPTEEVVGRHFADFITIDDVADSLVAYQQAMTEANLTGFENRLVSTDGAIRSISWNTAQENGLLYAYGRDITEQKAAANALAVAEAALRESQKMEAIGQLTGGIAHDFNNLLTAIIGSLEMMKRKAAKGREADVERYAAIAMTSADRAASLTQRLLAFSRRQSLDPRFVQADQLLFEMEDLIRRTIGENTALDVRRANIQEGGLWAIWCDPKQLENAVLTLCVNARDAMPDGGKLTIELANATVEDSAVGRRGDASTGQYVAVSVSDTGIGMEPDVIAKAFDPFFTTKPFGQGTGLGLSTIYGFVRQSGGFVTIESVVGKGTTLHLYLPRAAETGKIKDDDGGQGIDSRSNEDGTVLTV